MNSRGKMIYLVVLLTICLSACGQKFVWKKNMWKTSEKVSYEICLEQNMPEYLRELVEEKKNHKGSFTYTDSEHMYMVACYGTKEKSGYCIQVENVEKSEENIQVTLHLLGPAEGTEVKKASTPYIVLKCKKMEGICTVDF